MGNAETAVDGTIAELTDFILEIQKNNTGYFITYYDEAGNVLAGLIQRMYMLVSSLQEMQELHLRISSSRQCLLLMIQQRRKSL